MKLRKGRKRAHSVMYQGACASGLHRAYTQNDNKSWLEVRYSVLGSEFGRWSSLDHFGCVWTHSPEWSQRWDAWVWSVLARYTVEVHSHSVMAIYGSECRYVCSLQMLVSSTSLGVAEHVRRMIEIIASNEEIETENDQGWGWGKGWVWGWWGKGAVFIVVTQKEPLRSPWCPITLSHSSW